MNLPKVTYTEAVEMSLVTKKELTDIAKRAKDNLVQERLAKHEATKIKNALLEIDEDLTIYAWQNVRVKVESVAELTRARHALRAVLGKWNDNIGSTYVYGDEKEIEFTFMPEEEQVVSVYIEASFPMDAIPNGMLKEGCEIVSNVSTSYQVVCHR